MIEPILRHPLTLDDLHVQKASAWSKEHESYIKVVVAVTIEEVMEVGRVEGDGFEDLLCRKVVGDSVGVQDMDWRLAGNLNNHLLVEVTGYVDNVVLALQDRLVALSYEDDQGEEFSVEVTKEAPSPYYAVRLALEEQFKRLYWTDRVGNPARFHHRYRHRVKARYLEVVI